MKRLLVIALLVWAAAFRAGAQMPDIYEQLKAHPEYLDGTDFLCPTGPAVLTKAPKGYKPFYISHYGRHGARYAWPTHLGYRPIVDDIIACADERIASGEKGANIHFVFYRSKKSDTILFKVLLNGEEARLPLIETSTWPYYDWVEFKRVFER